MATPVAEGPDERDFIDKCEGKYGYNGKINRIRETEFCRLRGITYLDHTGTTLYPQSLLKRYYNDLNDNVYGNPHSGNPGSQLVTDIIEQTRCRILKHFNTTSQEYSVIFTAGATAALQLLADNFDWKVIEQKEGCCRSCFCYLQENHTSVVGMRERAAISGANILCVTEENLRIPCFMSSVNDGNTPLQLGINLSMDISGIFNHSVTGITSYCHSLFAFPALCNFSGRKYPLEWIGQAQNGYLVDGGPWCRWFALLDAASFVSTSSLDLSSCMADFVPISFYKMFGFPSGLGALIVRNSSSYVLSKSYYGGGTVQATISSERFHVLKTNIADRFEEGTLPFLDIIALHHAFDIFEKLTGTMKAVTEHTYSIASFVYKKMSALKHNNGNPLCEIYCNTDFKDETVQGPVINFNLLRASGAYVGYSEVEKMASLFNIHLRTGCFCNTGACQRYLDISNRQVKENLSSGHVCGDDVDLIDGKPTGSVRISFGYMSNFTDAQTFLDFLTDCFLLSGKQHDLHNDNGRSLNEMTPANDISDTSLSFVVGSSDVNVTDCPVEPLNDQSINKELNGLELEHRKANVPGSCTFSSVDEDGLDGAAVFAGITQVNVTRTKSEHDCLRLAPSSNNMRLDKICLYPIKSCAAFEVCEWEVGPRGFVYDRQWMIVNEAGVCLNQKREPSLCLIRPVLDLSSQLLHVTAPGMHHLVLPVQSSCDSHAVHCHSKVCGDRVSGWDCGDEAALWITSFLNKNCRLIEHDQQDGRTCKWKGDQEGGGRSLSLANESQFLLVRRESAEQLLTCMDTSKEGHTSPAVWGNQPLLIREPVDADKLVDRFRANFVVTGDAVPFAEDAWKTVQIGNLVFESQGRCNRCQMVCIDQDTGMRSAEPMKTLGKLRGSRMPFGIHLVHVTTGNKPFIVRRGDIVTTTVD